MLLRALPFVATLVVPFIANAQTAPTAPAPYPATAYGAPPAYAAPPSYGVAPAFMVDAPAKTRWYGWQTLSADGAALTVGLIGGIMDMKRTTDMSQDLLYASVGIYALGGPAVHWANGQVATGFKSLGLRVGLPVAGFLLPYALGPKCYAGDEGDNGSLACIPFIMGGVIAGLVAAVTIDAAVLAKEKVAPVGPYTSISVAPMLTADRRGAVVRLVF
jgi:hypothetical protein